MVESAGALVFEFGADFSGFSRAVDGAGQKLDQLSKAASRWRGEASSAASRPLAPSDRMATAAQALANPSARLARPGDGENPAAKELAHLGDQLALLRSVGAAHDTIALRMKTETEQAKLGADATEAQRGAVAALVAQIETAKTAQAALKAEQGATNDAWRFGSAQAERGLESIILYGGRVQDVARSFVSSFARQGLSAVLTGSGSLAGVFGTEGQGGRTGGLFGALQTLVSGGLSGSGGTGSIATSFSGLYANGGSIGAGQWGVAGEKGAEIVAGPATVVPWSKIPAAANGVSAQGHQTINFNVTTPDAPSFARSEGQMASLLSRAVGRGQRNQ